MLSWHQVATAIQSVLGVPLEQAASALTAAAVHSYPFVEVDPMDDERKGPVRAAGQTVTCMCV